MKTPVQLSLTQSDGSPRKVIIEPVLEEDDNGSLQNTGVYKIYKDAFDDESALFTEPLEINDINDELSDKDNPDYLGKIIITEDDKWKYDGDLLGDDEQMQVLKYIGE
ncbi:hypothetical protein SAMN05216490_2041 [Mucilaginibacter mallensis]|uniref:Uncharacterized protein n=1 Tax=Mucilaginibacter mallensis TaxID=652787 RepID=A0A1H1VZJ1_MUCMA|nr:hypothetical protein [Mucilaginibacter mallensis]SDS89666.1 hypothetical protein SAMN05216490_2041 [Mucilaginibacter mallensis]